LSEVTSETLAPAMGKTYSEIFTELRDYDRLLNAKIYAIHEGGKKKDDKAVPQNGG
jgi:hypothetical protein